MTRFGVRLLLSAALILLGWLVGGWPLAVVAALLAVPLFVRTQDGRVWWAAILTRVRFRIASARGLTHYTGDDGLPGPLALTTMVRDEPYAVLRDAGGNYSVLVVFDPDRADWLDLIVTEPALASVSITTQTGAVLRSGFSIAESAGALTRSVLREALPPTSGLPLAWACLTWRGQGLDVPQFRNVVERFLDKAGLDQPLPGWTVASLVSTAYRPTHNPVAVWDAAGPGSAHEFKNRYQHADVVSLVWHLTSGASAVGDLVTNDTEATLERITAIYTPQPTTGALRQSIVVTLTCPDERTLGAQAAALRARAQAAGVRLAPSAGTMASGFALGLGVGYLAGAR